MLIYPKTRNLLLKTACCLCYMNVQMFHQDVFSTTPENTFVLLFCTFYDSIRIAYKPVIVHEKRASLSAGL